MTTRIVALAGLFICAALAKAAPAQVPYPLEYWALREVINNAQVSPDGKYLGLMKIESKEGNPIIEVYPTGNLQAKPFRLNADPMEITNFYWASNNVIIFTLRQKVRKQIEGFNQGVYETRLAAVNVKTEKVHSFDESNPAIENVLPDKPGKIIISFMEGGDEDDPSAKLSEPFRPRSYWEFDLDKGTKQLLIRGKIALGQIEFTGDGHPWLARGFDLPHNELVWYWRRPGGSGWTEFHRQNFDEFETFEVLEIDDTKPDHVLVRANNGNDKLGLWSYDVDAKKFDELVYRRSDVDVIGLRHHSNSWKYPDKVTAVAYFKDKFHFEYFDAIEEATYRQLEGLIPSAYFLRINSRSRDGKTLTVVNSGPRDPGSYYLLKDGKLKSVGSREPLLKSKDLADLKYITYESRDGKTIPGFITVPNSDPPYPLVVLPHGGPFVQETLVYDEWAQMLANNGYLVLQPQYRGSLGYGRDFYLSAFRDGGQGGYKMQDDKDDGALYLVKQGLADRDRMAMFGWSYGGYAALVAASRTPQIYQCVIAGAAVSDPLMQVNYYRFQLRGAPELEQINMWDDSVSPIKEVERVNVPMLLIHGSVDQRVPIEHVKKYRKLLDEYGKPYKYVELEGADHFYSTLFYDHKIKLYESMIDFLKNDCGPGGL